MAGISKDGFVPKTLREIRDDIIAEVQAIQDERTGEYPFINIEDDTILSQLIGIFSAELEVAWGALADAYAQFDPQMNTGAGQSGTVQLNAITRKRGEYTRIAVTVTGIAGTYIEQGSLISDTTGEPAYALDEGVYLEGEPNTQVTAETTATCQAYGPNDPAIYSVNTIQLPQNGWTGVSNTRTILVGSEEETDEALRVRQQQSTSLTSYRQIEAIFAAITNVDGVTYCRVYQNDSTYPADSRGIPFKEVAAIVEGGDDKAVAEALFYRLPTGQIGYGTTHVTFNDIQGFPYVISFSRPTGVDIYIDLSITVYDTSAWPSTGSDDIKQSIIEYARYSLASNEGFPPGADVVRSRLYTPINRIPGFRIDSLKIGTEEGDTSEQDIVILWNQLAVFDADNMTITVEFGAEDQEL